MSRSRCESSTNQTHLELEAPPLRFRKQWPIVGTVKGDITSSEHAALLLFWDPAEAPGKFTWEHRGEGREGEGGVWRSFPPPHRAGRPLSGVSASKASGKTWFNNPFYKLDVWLETIKTWAGGGGGNYVIDKCAVIRTMTSPLSLIKHEGMKVKNHCGAFTLLPIITAPNTHRLHLSPERQTHTDFIPVWRFLPDSAVTLTADPQILLCHSAWLRAGFLHLSSKTQRLWSFYCVIIMNTTAAVNDPRCIAVFGSL